jgi:XTP/dITP diphosphohydrolase
MEITLITGNTGKMKEISTRLSKYDIELTMEEAPFIEVQGDTLEDVVITGMDLLGIDEHEKRFLMKDDSGLFIDSLGGFPGVYSSYVHKTVGNGGILKLMRDEKDRRATFKTVVGLLIPGEGLSLFRGECGGAISDEERGRQGFGYDPIFIPDGKNSTFAEMSLDEKNGISHRNMAVSRMVSFLKKSYL